MERDAYTRNLIDDMRAHGGQVTSGPVAGRPLMILTTTGAWSGALRTAIVTYTRDRDRYVIAASKGGAPTNPAWYHNLVSHPEALAEAGGESFAVRATVTTGAERERLWEQHAAERPEFREYPTRTQRVIPVLTLQRIDRDGPKEEES